MSTAEFSSRVVIVIGINQRKRVVELIDTLFLAVQLPW
jgi:hypothetical protein